MKSKQSRKPVGSVMIAIWILCAIMLIGVFAISFLTTTDVRTTANLAREVVATNLAESIACQVEARVNRHPWEKRFWLLEGQTRGSETAGAGISASVAFDKTTTYVNLSLDTFPPEQYEFTAQVKDVESTARTYRIYVEVTVQGEKSAFVWDKKCPENLLGAANTDSSQLGKALDGGSGPASASDTWIDTIKTAAGTPPAFTEEAQFQETLSKLKKDQTIFVLPSTLQLPTGANAGAPELPLKP